MTLKESIESDIFSNKANLKEADDVREYIRNLIESRTKYFEDRYLIYILGSTIYLDAIEFNINSIEELDLFLLLPYFHNVKLVTNLDYFIKYNNHFIGYIRYEKQSPIYSRCKGKYVNYKQYLSYTLETNIDCINIKL